MNYWTFKPTPTLSPVVVQYWALESEIERDQTYIHRTLANYCPELIFHYGGQFEELGTRDQIEKTFISGIHGQTDQIRRFTAKKRYGIFSVILQPYAIPVLFGFSSQEIKNELIDLHSLIGQDGQEITEKIMLAHDNKERVTIINAFLEKRLRNFERPEIVRAVNNIYHLKGQVNIKNLSDQVSFSQRQFQRKFIEHTGFSPKSFARLVRFKSVISNHRKELSSLTQAAYEYGYYDQAHFIEDFKQFSGYNPKAYFNGRADEVFYAP